MQIAHLHIHAKCEDLVGPLATLLRLAPLPEFRRRDAVRVTYSEEAPAARAAKNPSTGFEIRISSAASDKHVTPLLQSVDVSFPVRCLSLPIMKER